jgi:peptidoglycan/LPS O-acetylase OafA/YrhL
MAISIPVAWILLSPFDLVSFSKSLVAIPVFLSNVFFWRDGGYFETAAELKPLLHTWSLAAEEQYYLIFPVFLVSFWRLGKIKVQYLITLLAASSLIGAQLGASHWPVANFFLLPTRAWELAIGALISFQMAAGKRAADSNAKRQILSLVGLLLVTISIFSFTKDTPSPSFYTLTPTLGAAFIILFAQPDTLAGKFLGSKLLVFFGLTSYSAYLWHQPILAFAKYYIPQVDFTLKVSLIVLTMLLSIATWRFVETPFRNKNLFRRKFIFGFSLIGSTSFILFGYVSYKIFESACSESAEANLAKKLVGAKAVYVSNMDERKFVKYRIKYETFIPNAVAIGSSRIMQIGENNYPDKILNLGVSGSSVEDHIAIADMARRKFKPSIYFFGVDPWLFNSNSGQVRWKSLEDEYVRALSELRGDTALVNSASQEEVDFRLPSDSGFTGFGANIYNFINLQKLVAIDDTSELRDKISRDGVHVYNSTYANKSQKEVIATFDQLIDYSMGDFTYSQELEDLFGKLIDAYSRESVVVLILPPYHPELFERIKVQRPIYLQVEARFRDFAKKHGVKIIGSYDPNQVGCIGTEFYDGMHPNAICMSKVLRQLTRI